MDLIWQLLEGFFNIPDKVRDSLESALETILAITCTPFTFDWVSQLMAAFQGLALGIATVIILLRGVLTGILLEGGSEDESIGSYLFKSFVPVAVIAACPTLVSAAVSFTTSLVGAFMGTGGETAAQAIVQSMATITASGVSAETATDVANGAAGVGEVVGETLSLANDPAAIFINGILLIVTVVYAISIAMQCLRRWIQLEVLSVITPLTAVTTALEDSSDFTTILKSMLYLGVMTIIQIALLSSMGGMATFAHDALGLDSVGRAFVMCAAFGAIKQVPDWIEKYTYSAGVTPRGNSKGSMAAYAGVRAMTSVVRKALTKGV